MKMRIIETTDGIQGEADVALFDRMQRHLRDKGWIGTDRLLAFGINAGVALEVGPGPGYLGLEWLSKTNGTSLKTVEISPNMIAVAQKNAAEYGLLPRVEYRLGRAEEIPFGDETFDAVFSNGSLHEWSDPLQAFHEVHRVLRQGGRYAITDLKRNMNPLARWFLKTSVRPKEMQSGLLSSIHAAYTKKEIEQIVARTTVKSATVSESQIGLTITGIK